MSIITESEMSDDDQYMANNFNSTYTKELDMYLEMFYIPQCPQYDELKDLILRNGGRVTEYHECFTYQVKPDNSQTSFEHFYKGDIYAGKWIIQSVQNKQLMKKEEFFICVNVSLKSLTLNFAKKKKYTIIEGMKLYETVTNQKNAQTNSKRFWLKAESSMMLPERSADSMKIFWNKIRYKTLEQYLIECIYKKVDFCLSFKEIPNPDFIRRFKQQYANEFLKLEAFNEVSDEEAQDQKMAYIETEKMASSYGISKNIVRNSASLDPDSQIKSFTPRSIAQSFTKEEAELYNLAAKEIMMQEAQQKSVYHFKTLQKLDQSQLSYSPQEYTTTDSIYFSLDKKQLNLVNFEQELENHLTLRMNKFVPSNFDLTDYDKELFLKQLDLETVEINITKNIAKAIEFDVEQFYERSVKRFPKEEGTFRRLQMEHNEISKKYGVDDYEINQLLSGVSCSKAKLFEALERESFSKWNELDDLVLRRSTESEEYKFLLRSKGVDEIARRKQKEASKERKMKSQIISHRLQDLSREKLQFEGRQNQLQTDYLHHAQGNIMTKLQVDIVKTKIGKGMSKYNQNAEDRHSNHGNKNRSEGKEDIFNAKEKYQEQLKQRQEREKQDRRKRLEKRTIMKELIAGELGNGRYLGKRIRRQDSEVEDSYYNEYDDEQNSRANRQGEQKVDLQYDILLNGDLIIIFQKDLEDPNKIINPTMVIKGSWKLSIEEFQEEFIYKKINDPMQEELLTELFCDEPSEKINHENFKQQVPNEQMQGVIDQFINCKGLYQGYFKYNEEDVTENFSFILRKPRNSNKQNLFDICGYGENDVGPFIMEGQLNFYGFENFQEKSEVKNFIKLKLGKFNLKKSYKKKILQELVNKVRAKRNCTQQNGNDFEIEEDMPAEYKELLIMQDSKVQFNNTDKNSNIQKQQMNQNTEKGQEEVPKLAKSNKAKGGKPKRPLPAFFHFCAERRITLKQEEPELGIAQQTKKMSEEWKNLDAKKKKYEDLYAKDKERYQKECYEQNGIKKKNKVSSDAADVEDKPKRPINACFLYQSDRMDKLEQEQSGKAHTEYINILSKELQEMDKAKKMKYEKQTQEAKDKNYATNINGDKKAAPAKDAKKTMPDKKNKESEEEEDNNNNAYDDDDMINHHCQSLNTHNNQMFASHNDYELQHYQTSEIEDSNEDEDANTVSVYKTSDAAQQPPSQTLTQQNTWKQQQQITTGGSIMDDYRNYLSGDSDGRCGDAVDMDLQTPEKLRQASKNYKTYLNGTDNDSLKHINEEEKENTSNNIGSEKDIQW